MGFEHLEYGELRESSSQHLSYSHIKSKRLTQRSFAFVARERAVLRTHGFEHLFQVRREPTSDAKKGYFHEFFDRFIIIDIDIKVVRLDK